MPGPVPGIHVLLASGKERRGWPGQAWTSPAMTTVGFPITENCATMDRHYSGGERHMTASLAKTIAASIAIVTIAGTAHAQQRFRLIDATIDGIHTEMRAGRLTCTQLVQAYLDRIKAYDQAGP